MRPCHNQHSAKNGNHDVSNSDTTHDEYQQFITPPRFWSPLVPPLLPVSPMQRNVKGILQVVTGEGCITVATNDTGTGGETNSNNNNNNNSSQGTLVIQECFNGTDQLFLYDKDTHQIRVQLAVASTTSSQDSCLEWADDRSTIDVQPCHNNSSGDYSRMPQQQQWHFDMEGRIYHYPSSTTTRVLCLETGTKHTTTTTTTTTSPATINTPLATPGAISAPSMAPRQLLQAFQTKQLPTSNIFAGTTSELMSPASTQAPQTMVTRQPIALSTSPALISPSRLLQVHTGPCSSGNYHHDSMIYGPIPRQTFTFSRPWPPTTTGVLQQGKGVIFFPFFEICLTYFSADSRVFRDVVQAVSCDDHSTFTDSADDSSQLFEYDSDTGVIVTADGSRRCLASSSTLSRLVLTSTSCPQWSPIDTGGMRLHEVGCMSYDSINRDPIVNRTKTCHEEDSQIVSWFPVFEEEKIPPSLAASGGPGVTNGDGAGDNGGNVGGGIGDGSGTNPLGDNLGLGEDAKGAQVRVAIRVSNLENIRDPNAIKAEGLDASFPIFSNKMVNEIAEKDSETRHILHNGRHLRVVAVPGTQKIENVAEYNCPSNALPGLTCHSALATYDVLMSSEEDQVQVQKAYMDGTQTAVDDGTYNNILQQVNPETPLYIGIMIDREQIPPASLSQPPTSALTNMEGTTTASIPRPLATGTTAGPSWTFEPSTQAPGVTMRPTGLGRDKPGGRNDS